MKQGEGKWLKCEIDPCTKCKATDIATDKGLVVCILCWSARTDLLVRRKVESDEA